MGKREYQYVPKSLGIRKNDYPTRIITDGFGQYEAGVLFAQNIKYKGLAVPVDIARDLFDSFIEIKQIAGIEVIKSINNGKIALLEVNISEDVISQDNIEFYESLQVGKLYSVSVLYSTMSFYILSIEDTQLRGYIDKEEVGHIEVCEDIELQLQLYRKAASPLQLSHFVKPTIAKEGFLDTVSFDDEEKQKRFFLTPEERSVISDEDIKLIELMLDEYPTLTKDTLSVISEYPFFCKYSDMQPSLELEKFINERPSYFQNGTFWLNIFLEKKTGKNKIVLFDENSTVLVVDTSNKEFSIDQFYADKTTHTAKRIIQRNNYTKLKISGDKLHFLKQTEATPHEYSTEKVVTYLERMKDLNVRILKEVKGKIGFKIEKDAFEYGILQKYLEFEKNLEENNNGEIIYIPPDKINLTAGEHIGGTTALLLKMSENQAKQLLGNVSQTDEEVYVSILDNEEKPMYSGKLSFKENDEYFLSFYESHDLNIHRINGIRIVQSSNTKHLDVQLSALKGFVKKDTLNIHKDLVFDKLETPDTSKYNDIVFFNENIAKAKADNRQAEAVKKALGNKSMLLIQGPPGTGKTSVIVEIICQLAKEGKKILVCSQAHAAVDNIYNRIKSNNEILKALRINNEGNTESWGDNFDENDYENFIKNNRYVLQKLFSEQPIVDIKKHIDEIIDYNNQTESNYKKIHHNLCNYYPEIKNIRDKEKLIQILEFLEEKSVGITGLLLETQRYQSMDMILGTCIGVGMNYILKKGSVKFDTVIIDEAAKANLAETIVPLRLGDRYVLVGDYNQLPPYIDREKINVFISQSNADNLENTKETTGSIGQNNEMEEQQLKENDVIKALSTSLFEDFHNHRNFPEENSVLLNYQYRMNPTIGDFISKLFYNSELRNGFGTDKEHINTPRFPAPVIFYDTSNHKERSYETREPTGSYFNIKEIDIICNSIIPEIIPLLTEDPSLKVGIISPYSAQCKRLKERIENKQLKESVYTVDSIQGSEFDIVIFSFVRSFSPKSNSNIGFLSDLRRLNVSLSRAKKKLILVGNKETLTRKKAHPGSTNTDRVSTLDVFKAITENTKSIFDISDLEHFKQNCPKIGTVFTDCKWKYEKKDLVSFDINLKGRELKFRMPLYQSKYDLNKKTTIDVLFEGLNKKGMPMFCYYDASISIADKLIKGCLKKFTAKIININNTEVLLSFTDDSQHTINLPPEVCYLLDKGNEYPFYVTNNKIYFDRSEDYKQFIDTHDIANGKYLGLVKKEDDHNFYVSIDGFYATISKNDFTTPRIKLGQEYFFSINKTNDRRKSIQLKFEYETNYKNTKARYGM